jgi:transposase
VLAAYDRGEPTKRIAEMFGVSRAWARAVNHRRLQTGDTTARPMGGATIIKIDRATLAGLVKDDPDATLKDLRERLGVRCAESAIWKVLRALGFSYKKKRSSPRSRSARMSPSDAKTGARSNPNSTRRD